MSRGHNYALLYSEFTLFRNRFLNTCRFLGLHLSVFTWFYHVFFQINCFYCLSL